LLIAAYHTELAALANQFHALAKFRDTKAEKFCDFSASSAAPARQPTARPNQNGSDPLRQANYPTP
jgi:hypothetical protein